MKLHIPSDRSLEEAQAQALDVVDAYVSKARARLNATADQAVVYQAKYEAAMRFLRTAEPEPFIQSYAEIEGTDETQAARAIIQAHRRDERKQVAIERARITVRRAIMNANSTSAVYAVLRAAKESVRGEE